MPQPLNYLRETASQTAGPYVHIGLAPGAAGFKLFERELGTDIAGPNAAGQRIRVEGMVFDGAGAPVKDVLIEVWQANSAGIYPHPEDPRAAEVEEGFRGWGRVISDFDTGLYAFETVKPGPVPGRASMGPLRPASQEEQRDAHGRGHQGLRPMAPHLNLWIVARGINIGLNTRMYFSDEEEANAADPVLNLVENPERRPTLIATREESDGALVYRFDIRLQGENETVFFDV
jgi:protocatechuate 3,4-dioxygenase, alpha subunit